MNNIYFEITEQLDGNFITYTEEFQKYLETDNTLNNLILELDHIYKSLELKSIRKNKQIIDFLTNNKNVIINKFISYYYWMTDLPLNNLIISEVLNYKNLTALTKNIKNIIGENLIVHKKCSKCNKLNQKDFVPSNKTNFKRILEEEYICDCCKEEIINLQKIKEEFERTFIKSEVQILNTLSTNIIVTKYQENFYIDFETNDFIRLIPTNLIHIINDAFKIDSIDRNNSFLTKEKNNQIDKLIKNNISIVKNYLFVTLYTYFTTFKFDNLYNFYNSEAVSKNTSQFIVRNIDSKGNMFFEYPATRTSSKHVNYCEFRNWLFNKYPDGFTFENLFIENSFNMQSFKLNKNFNMEDADTLRKMPYKDYLQSEHWKRTRNKALNKANYKCELCNSEIELNVHHKTYENKGCEKSNDLIVLCHNCHAKFHNKFGEPNENININNNIGKYLENISSNALKEKMIELNKLFGFDFIKNIHIEFDFNKLIV